MVRRGKTTMALWRRKERNDTSRSCKGDPYDAWSHGVVQRVHGLCWQPPAREYLAQNARVTYRVAGMCGGSHPFVRKPSRFECGLAGWSEGMDVGQG